MYKLPTNAIYTDNNIYAFKLYFFINRILF